MEWISEGAMGEEQRKIVEMAAWLNLPNSPKSWSDDSPYENGNYTCVCVFCKDQFVGHKRRVVCKVCSDERNLTPKNQ